MTDSYISDSIPRNTIMVKKGGFYSVLDIEQMFVYYSSTNDR